MRASGPHPPQHPPRRRRQRLRHAAQRGAACRIASSKRVAELIWLPGSQPHAQQLPCKRATQPGTQRLAPQNHMPHSSLSRRPCPACMWLLETILSQCPMGTLSWANPHSKSSTSHTVAATAARAPRKHACMALLAAHNPGRPAEQKEKQCIPNQGSIKNQSPAGPCSSSSSEEASGSAPLSSPGEAPSMGAGPADGAGPGAAGSATSGCIPRHSLGPPSLACLLALLTVWVTCQVQVCFSCRACPVHCTGGKTRLERLCLGNLIAAQHGGKRRERGLLGRAR